ncbi:MAG: leucine-rich repeat domain-containing protein, partial [Bacteroidia bacterium]
MKNLISVFGFLLISAVGVCQVVNIPDANFKAILLNDIIINTNGDSEIQTEEAAALSGSLYLSSANISDLTGIEAFTGLTDLKCSNNQLTSLDLSANTALTQLRCENNQLTNLNVSANTALTELKCYNNLLTSLDVSGATALIYLNCWNNQLTSLDVSTNAALTDLNCASNQLTSLDVSANTALYYLGCSDNQLTSLDVSTNPALNWLYCSNNQLTSLNVQNGHNVNIHGDGFGATNNPDLTCIEVDDVAWATANWSESIDATAGFGTNCNISVRGTIFRDANANCLPDSAETRLVSRMVQALPGPRYATADSLGNYTLWVDTGSFIVSLVPRLYQEQDCPTDNGTYSVSFSGNDTMVNGRDFSSYITDFCPDVRIGLGTGFQRRCFNDNEYIVNVCNEGTAAATDATIAVLFPPQIIPLSASINWAMGQPGEYIFNVGNLAANECRQITILDSVACNALLGTSVCVSASVVLTPQAADCNQADNLTSDCNILIGAYDPNDKQVASQNFQQNGYLMSEEVLPDAPLSYLIRFQNTGNDTAFTVVVRDTLSQWLNPVTVVTDVASHSYQFSISGRGVLEWKFNNILLPDSFVNEPASHGFIKYRVLMHDTIPIGTQIRNKAEIYFDYNDPIITNETVSTLSLSAGNREISSMITFTIHPQPPTKHHNPTPPKKTPKHL